MQPSWVVGILLGNVILVVFLSKKNLDRLFKTGVFKRMACFMLLGAITIPLFSGVLGGASWLCFAVIEGIFLFIGAHNAFVNTPLMTAFHRKTPTEYRFRVFSVIALVAQMTAPLGAMFFRVALDYVLVHWLFLIAATGNAITTVAFLSLGMSGILTPSKSEKASEEVESGDLAVLGQVKP